MATEENKSLGREPVKLDDLVAQINSWIRSAKTQRKVLARQSRRGQMKREERMMIQAARMVQDHGLISIITKVQDETITFMAERVPQ